jgi:hypothetical protein
MNSRERGALGPAMQKGCGSSSSRGHTGERGNMGKVRSQDL